MKRDGKYYLTAPIRARALQTAEIKTIKQSDLRACPFVVFLPTHYRADGTCKCDDAAERARMILEWDYSADDFKNIPLRETK